MSKVLLSMKDQGWSGSGVIVYKRNVTTLSTWPEWSWENNNHENLLGWGCLMSTTSLESLGCHLIPLSYLLS